MSSPAALTLRRLSKTYRLPWKRARLRALDALDLDIAPGEVFGLLGPNGSGKSTTLKLILGLARPDGSADAAAGGSALVFGHPAGSEAARRRIGFMPEEPRFYRFLNGAELLRFHGALAGLSGAALEKRIAEMLALVGLDEAGRDRPLSSYSKGMLQRIGLAQALLHDPDLVILDEPTAGVDPLGAREIRALVGRLKAAGKTVLFSTHLLTEAEALADRVAILHRGRKILEGTPAALLSLPGATDIAVRGGRSLAEADREAVAALLRERDAGEATFRAARLPLEEVFVRAVEAEARQKGTTP
ncbi:ABC-2 type transport system ATP-binding protein [Verrucomicrobium sp. GAS474]|uniref:ABC transporter ATP-binding protein n=1 Tax=Verrucomicrobium sp. GAS474 TaxID=1882831 RepID=UPI00087B9E7E|nr:ABC transporter ATP-binding protein [Verrucomicrobium sp. GAS474]SDT93687.1 ABC-2 type transport system ATP-binding protein [Verrucomicrobium sp. GAS474]